MNLLGNWSKEKTMKDKFIERLEKITYTKNEALDDLRVELKELLSVAISDEYVDKIIDAIYDSVKFDIEENSAEAEAGYHSVDDVRLAIGRELMDKYNLW